MDTNFFPEMDAELAELQRKLEQPVPFSFATPEEHLDSISAALQPEPRTGPDWFDWVRRCNPRKPLTNVYFVQCNFQQKGPIKIGVARDVEARIAGIRTGNPYPLWLRAQREAPHVAERMLHKRFKKLHLTGEWFRPGRELMTFIYQLERK